MSTKKMNCCKPQNLENNSGKCFDPPKIYNEKCYDSMFNTKTTITSNNGLNKVELTS